MEEKRIKFLGFVGGIFLAVILLWGIGAAQAGMIKMGKIIDQDNYKEYETLLTPNMIWGVKKGDWIYPTGELTYSLQHDKKFLNASGKNAGKYDVDNKGALIDKRTGKFPEQNVYGFPFPNIDPKDPKVGTKVMWNFFFQRYRLMGIIRSSRISWLQPNAKRPDREVGNKTYYLSFQGRPPGQEIKNNPSGFLNQDISTTLTPMDFRGSNSMTWEYIGEKDSTVFSYIPSIRRIRRGSGAIRSDPFLGSDVWTDAQNGFSGKPMAFEWKLIGERMLLIPYTGLEKMKGTVNPDGSLSTNSPMKYGYETPGWKHAPWAFSNAVWIPRPVWIIEGMPKDPYYNFGKHIFYVDKENFAINQKDFYDKAGELWMWHLSAGHYTEAPSGDNTLGFIFSGSCIDMRKLHGTAIAIPDARCFIPLSSLGPEFYTMDNFLQKSK